MSLQLLNFGLQAAETVSLVCGTPVNFKGVKRLGSVTARHSSSGRERNFSALNRRRHLYSAGRPLRWAFAHISSCYFIAAFRLRCGRAWVIACWTPSFDAVLIRPFCQITSRDIHERSDWIQIMFAGMPSFAYWGSKRQKPSDMINCIVHSFKHKLSKTDL